MLLQFRATVVTLGCTSSWLRKELLFYQPMTRGMSQKMNHKQPMINCIPNRRSVPALSGFHSASPPLQCTTQCTDVWIVWSMKILCFGETNANCQGDLVWLVAGSHWLLLATTCVVNSYPNYFQFDFYLSIASFWVSFRTHFKYSKSENLVDRLFFFHIWNDEQCKITSVLKCLW